MLEICTKTSSLPLQFLFYDFMSSFDSKSPKNALKTAKMTKNFLFSAIYFIFVSFFHFRRKTRLFVEKRKPQALISNSHSWSPLYTLDYLEQQARGADKLKEVRVGALTIFNFDVTCCIHMEILLQHQEFRRRVTRCCFSLYRVYQSFHH